jgi:2-oxoglutarate ferredoxin oxidoreductase subunit gamma
LDASIECRPVVFIPSILEALKKVLPDKYHHLNPINQQALKKGREMLLTSKAAMRV